MQVIKNVTFDAENKTLEFTVAERVDSNNAQLFQNEFEVLDSSYAADRIVLNMTDTVYMSSAGLRVLLLIKKRHKNAIMKEVGKELYEILDTTCFNQIIPCEKKLKEYSIEEMELIGTGGFANVYKIDEDTIIKVFSDEQTIEEIKREMEISKAAFLAGIATAIPYEIVKVGDHLATVYEMVKADTLSKTMHDHPDQIDVWAEKFGKFMRRMHQVELDVTAFPNAKESYNTYKDTIAPFLDPEAARIYVELIDNIPNGTTFTHGDCHPKNVMTQNGELVLIDMGETAYGSPLMDFMAFGTAVVCTDIFPDELSFSLLGMNVEEALQAWKVYLKSYFECDDAKYEKINNTLLLYSCIRALMFTVRIKEVSVFTAPLSAKLKRLYEAADKDLSFISVQG